MAVGDSCLNSKKDRISLEVLLFGQLKDHLKEYVNTLWIFACLEWIRYIIKIVFAAALDPYKPWDDLSILQI
jgi:hypothetical protein